MGRRDMVRPKEKKTHEGKKREMKKTNKQSNASSLLLFVRSPPFITLRFVLCPSPRPPIPLSNFATHHYTSISASLSLSGHRASKGPRKSNMCRKSCASTSTGHTSDTHASPTNARRRAVRGSRLLLLLLPPSPSPVPQQKGYRSSGERCR